MAARAPLQKVLDSPLMNLKRAALEIEDRIENKLQTFAGLLSRQDYDWNIVNEMDTEILRAIDQFTALMASFDDSKAKEDYSRHLSDYNREYQRVKNLLNQAKDREDLMSSIQKDLKSSHDDQAYLLDERIRIDKSRNMADDILEQALYAQEDLGRQRSIIFDGRSRLGNTMARFPVLNSLMSKIRFRKTRDILIMSILIGGGFCFFIWYFLM